MAATGSFTGRVGHKAGGFIAKKFFHPSNYKNQEKLWQAIEAKKEQERRQDELLKKREEERRIEMLKQEMYSGSSSSSAFKQALSSNKPGLILNGNQDSCRSTNPEVRRAISETKKRMEEYYRSTTTGGQYLDRKKSRYTEDMHEFGHTAIWGSYYDLDERKWGYACCKTIDRCTSCPVSSKTIKR
jgi:hypothetical protein